MVLIAGSVDSTTALNDVHSTPDGYTWTQLTAAAAFPAIRVHACVSLPASDILWVMAGKNTAGTPLNDIWWSLDGVQWTLGTQAASFSARSNFGYAVWRDSVWIIGGFDAVGGLEDIHRGSFAVNPLRWSKTTVTTPLPVRSTHAAAFFKGKIYVM